MTVLSTGRRRVVPGFVGLDGAGSVAALVGVGPAVVLQGRPRTRPRDAAQDVDELDVVGGGTARWQAEVTGPHSPQHLVSAGLASPAEGEQSPWLDEEAAVVADEVNYRQGVLAATAAQTTAQLLKEHDRGLGGAQHQDRVDLWHVEAFVEHVDRADNLQLARAQLLHRADTRRTSGAAVYGNRGDAVAAEELSREVGVGDGDAERDGATTALAAPDVESMLGAFLRLDGLGQCR